jgi:hypothetical protein
MSKKVTTEEFIKRAKNVHSDIFDYSKVVYIDAHTKIIIICKLHGEFIQKPYKHTNEKQGCPKCKVGKTKQTNLEKYGTICSLHNESVNNKSIETWRVKYDTDHPLKSNIIIKKRKLTNLERYGDESHMRMHMLDILPFIENKEWLVEQYINLSKTSSHIAKELGITHKTLLDNLRKNGIEIRYTVGYSRKAIQWLDYIMDNENIFIQHAGNIGEYKIPGTKYKVDGYCANNNTVYEFHGDCFHGNPDLFKEYDRPHFYKNHLTAKELYDKTIERENKIKELGFNLVVMWENDFNG